MLSASAPVVAPEDIKLTAADRRSQAAYARRQARYEEAARLRAAGTSIKRIAAVLGTERKTIRRWLRAGAAPRWWKPPQAGVLSPYREHLERRWAEGCRNAALLWRELVQHGFTGRPGVVRQWAGRRRADERQGALNGKASPAPLREPPSSQQ